MKYVVVAFSMLAMLAGGAGPAQAGTTTQTKIAHILVYETGNLIYVYPEGGTVNPPTCSGNGTYYSFKMSRPMAKEYYAGLLAAQARGALVTLYGSGACTDQSISETLRYFSIKSVP